MSDCMFWTRQKVDKLATKTAKKVGESEKESPKWVLCAQNSHAALSHAGMTTFVFDREADVFQVYETVGGLPNSHFIIRMQHDRYVDWQGQRLKTSEALRQCPVWRTYEIDLPALDHYSSTSGKRTKRAARKATIEVKCCAASMRPPSGSTAFSDHPPLPIYIVEAREVAPGLPPGEDPILWVLATDHPTNTFEQARAIIQFYTQRWCIEQLFRTMKSEGLQIEATERETFDAILRQTVMAFQTATRVLQLVYARHSYDSQPIGGGFDQPQQEVLMKINQKFQRTTKQFNSFPKNQVIWATFIIAWLGGWKGNLSQRPQVHPL